jgi:hypothetical protein
VSIYPEDNEVQFDSHEEDIEEEARGLSLTAKLLILLLIMALLVTLVWPLFYYRPRQHTVPTPTPSFLLEA